MNVLLTALFLLGIVAGIFLRSLKTQPTQTRQTPGQSNKFDMVDDMFLYGEVNQDDFYR